MGFAPKLHAASDDPFPHLWTGLERYAEVRHGDVFGSLPAVSKAPTVPESAAEPPVEEPPAEPGEAVATVTMARLLEKQGHVGEARDVLRSILRRQPTHREAAEKLLAGMRSEPWSLRASDLLGDAGAVPKQGIELRRELFSLYVERVRSGDR